MSKLNLYMANQLKDAEKILLRTWLMSKLLMFLTKTVFILDEENDLQMKTSKVRKCVAQLHKIKKK